MQTYLDFFIVNWHIILAITVVLMIVVGILIKKGRLESLDLFGIKINFNHNDTLQTSFNSHNIKDYNIKFTKTAQENISLLHITEGKVIDLVDHEFTHHVNYFIWDLQDYPLPAQQSYIIVLDKVGKSITIRAVKKSNLGEAQLTSITNLLSDYRRLTRYKYRTEKNYVLRAETIKNISKTHKDITHRIIKHYELFKEPTWDSKDASFQIFVTAYRELAEMVDDPLKIDEFLQKAEKALPSDKEFAYNVLAAHKALHEIEQLTYDLENSLISSEIADREIVLCLERSLQYIHKTLNLLFEN